MNDNNKVLLTGKVNGSRKIVKLGNGVYEADLIVNRQSETKDEIHIVYPSEVSTPIMTGTVITVYGETRSLKIKGTSIIYVWCREIKVVGESDGTNECSFTGKVASHTKYHVTLKNKIKICSLVLSIHRIGSEKSDFIPLVFWGSLAEEAICFKIGDSINVHGRLQSRIYCKTDKEGFKQVHHITELSVSDYSYNRGE